MTTLHDAIQSICDRIEHGSLEDEKEILDALEEALSKNTMTQDIEKYAQAIIDVGAEVDSHIDGDARIQTFTFNEAQVIAFAELVAEEGVKAERERVKEWIKERAKKGHTSNFNSIGQVLSDVLTLLSDNQ